MATRSKFLAALVFAFLGVTEFHATRTTVPFANLVPGYPGWIRDGGGTYFTSYGGNGRWEGGEYRPIDRYWFSHHGGIGSRAGNQHDADNRFGWTFRYGFGYKPGDNWGGRHWWNAGRNYQGGGSSWADSTSTGNGFGSGFGYSYGRGKHSSSSSSSGTGQFDSHRTGHEVTDIVGTTKVYATHKDGTISKLSSNDAGHSRDHGG